MISQAALYVTPVALAYFFLGGSNLTDGAFYIKRRVNLKLWIPAIGTSVMLVLCLALIPRFKVVGAVYATAGSHALLLVLRHSGNRFD